jgi:hypothetical protein
MGTKAALMLGYWGGSGCCFIIAAVTICMSYGCACLLLVMPVLAEAHPATGGGPVVVKTLMVVVLVLVMMVVAAAVQCRWRPRWW